MVNGSNGPGRSRAGGAGRKRQANRVSRGRIDRLNITLSAASQKVAPTVREDNDGSEDQRIISARKDVPKEGKRYEQDRQVRGRPGRTCHR